MALAAAAAEEAAEAEADSQSEAVQLLRTVAQLCYDFEPQRAKYVAALLSSITPSAKPRARGADEPAAPVEEEEEEEGPPPPPAEPTWEVVEGHGCALDPCTQPAEIVDLKKLLEVVLEGQLKDTGVFAWTICEGRTLFYRSARRARQPT